MPDLIVGYPAQVTVDGDDIYLPDGEYDEMIFNMLANTPGSYLATVTPGTPTSAAITAVGGKQTAGTWKDWYKLTVATGHGINTGDRCCPQRQATVYHYTTIASALSAKSNGDTFLLHRASAYSTQWQEDMLLSGAWVDIYGMLPAQRIVILGRNNVVGFAGDLSGQSTQIVVANITGVIWDGLKNGISYTPSAGLQGAGLLIDRCKVQGAYQGIYVTVATAGTVEVRNSIVTRCAIAVKATNPLTCNSVIAAQSSYGFNATGAGVLTLKNCVAADCFTSEYALGTGGTAEKCVGTAGELPSATNNTPSATAAQLAASGLLYFSGVDGKYLDDFRLKSGGTFAGAGVAVAGVTYDIDGQTRQNPPAIGASEGFALAPEVDTIDAPTLDSATAGDTQVVLSATAADEAHTLYARWRTPGGSWTADNASFSRTGSGAITVTGLTNGQPYEFIVKASYVGVPSDFSDALYATPTDGLNTPDGCLSESLQLLRSMISQSATWQAWTGSEGSEDAATHVYYHALDGFDGPADIDVLEAARPYAIIAMGGDFVRTAVAGGARTEYVPEGEAAMLIEAAIDETYSGLGPAELWFENRIGTMLSEIGNLSGTAGALMIRTMTVTPPRRADEKQIPHEGDFIQCLVTFEWGV